MNNQKRITIVVLMLLVTNLAKSQFIGSLLNEELYNYRIKLVDEFFERFNGKRFRPDIDINSDDAKLKNLLVLFNAKMFKSLEDSAFIEAKSFAKKILQDSITIHYHDSTWIAKAVCHGTLKGKSVEFILYLNVENRRGNLYKWVISKAEGNIFELTPSLQKETIMLLPDDHETNFMSLRRITTEKDDYILNYKQKSFHVDQTTVFFTLVNTGLLNIEYVKSLDFIFFQVPGYTFSISHFEREKNNAGWLISTLEKKTEEEKANTLKYIYNK